ncbi:MarR family transcriptional regulator [Nocardia yunnanensis]|uniref:MarR family transcriptional regulator n=1 Tax=Nocardia yunnanensis TaxID=2382165 RepID=A0A386ZLB6_9NOCA|nr:MarR family transcriptional regulator [Nocardia yunnanensis]AYF78642.1 MarR family transcriptional regulator [Nocardia yunnanensis]
MLAKDVAVGESADEITDALLAASRLLVALSARSIALVDETITIPQFRTLVILSTRGPLKGVALSNALDVQPSTTARMVDRLVSVGLVNRKQNPDSRRELIIELTALGHRIVDQVTAHRRREIVAVVERMPERDRSGLVRALTAFTVAGGEPHRDLDVDSYQL